MKKNLKITSKLLSVILAIALIITSLPMQAFAKGRIVKDYTNSNDSELLIQGEVVDERDEFKKVYELSDGTFYEITSIIPIHYKENGEWVEAEVNSDVPNTVDEALDYCSDLAQSNELQSSISNINPSIGTNSIDVSENETSGTSSVTYKIIGKSDVTSSSKLNKTTYLVAKFNNQDLLNNINNRATISCNFMFRSKCSKSVNVYAHQITSQFDITDSNLVGTSINYSNATLDYAAIKSTSDYSFDITDLYIKWERGLDDNNGILLETNTAYNITVYSCFITRQYRIFDLYDSNYSHHKVSMGRAGTVYINDYTNTVMLAREEFSLDSSVVPLSLTRYYDFGKTDEAANPFGDSGWWNYESYLKVITSLNYRWQTPNGNSIYFIPNPELNSNGTNKYWMDYKGEGYSLELDLTKENLFENAIITTPYNETYVFGPAGKIISITDENSNEIIIKYREDDLTQTNIFYIQDSLERRLYFNYTDIQFGDSNDYEVLDSITAKYKTSSGLYATINIDGAAAIMSYSYIAKDSEKVLLSGVTYPDGESVTYSYTNNMITDITDIDGKTLHLSYNYTTSENDSRNIYPCLTSYRVVVRDEEYNRNVLLSSLDIDCHNSYQRVFTNEQNQDEVLQYNRNLRLIYYHTPESTMFADYSKNSHGYEFMSQIISPENAENLVDDPGFEGENDCWSFDQGVLESENSISGDYSVKLTGAPMVTRMATQVIEINGQEGDVYALGGCGMANTPIPTNKYFWGLQVHSFGEDDEGNEVDNQLFSIMFDSSIDSESQMRLGAFVLPEDTEEVEIQLIYSYQEGQALFDDIIFYKTTDEYATILQDPWSFASEDDIPNNTSSPSEGYNQDGLLTYELYTKDSTNLLKTYEYNSDTLYRSTYTDENNVSVSTNYDANTGTLSSETLGNMTKEYSYNAVGALKEVSRADAAINGDTSKITTKYSYSNDKIETIEHNGFVYTFTYNPYGSVSKVELNRTDSDTKDSFIEYEYTDDTSQGITKIIYANGSQIISTTEDLENSNYSYSKLIKFKNSSGQEELQYRYLFNSNDDLLRVIDYQSLRIIDYTSNSYIVYDALAADIDSNNPTISEICEISTNNSTGVKTIELFNDAYTVTSHDGLYDENSKTTTYISDYDFSFGNGTLSFSSTSVLDFFGRKTTSSTVFDDDAMTKSITSTYTYKDFANRSYSYYDDTTNTNTSETINTSSTLVSKYQTDIVATNKKSEEESTVTHSFISTYEYDNAGRVKEVRYGNSEDDLQLTHAYEYDCFGQLSKEIDFIHNECTIYSYDYAGNIIEKTIYSEGQFNYNNSVITITYQAPSENEEENSESETTVQPKVISYSYSKDNPSSAPIQNNDLLVQYNGKNITYDEMGNPNVYYSESLLSNSNDKDIIMDLAWRGTQLSSATNRTTGAKTEYKYDQDGNRTKKIFYEMQDVEVEENEDPRQELVKKGEIDYVYYDDMVSGYKIISSTSDNESTNAFVKLIYDEYNTPIGLSVSSPTDISVDGNVILAQNDILWFIKDGQGNVLGMYSEVSDFAVGCSYDAYGKLVIDNINMSAADDLTRQFQQAIQENPRWAGLLTLIYVITLAALVAAVVPTLTQINQTYYQGYIFDAETGLYYCHNRYYSSEYGRFINMDDPAVLTQNMEEPLNANLYCYCYNDPINNNDPSGRSSYTLTGVGMQAEMSASFLSFAAEVGIELIYAIPKNTLYAYYYGSGAENGYSTKAISYFRNVLNKIALNPNVSLNNIANLFKFNYSISLGFFIARTNKSFSWPNSYTGYATSNSISIGKYKGYYSTGKGSKIYGICYCPIGNSGFGLSRTSVYYKRITFNSDKVKNYLSQNTNKIKTAIGK